MSSEADEVIRNANSVEAAAGSYTAAWLVVRQFRAACNAAEAPSVQTLEQKIWVHWISGLADNDLLDRDEIEDYLHGSIGVLGSRGILGVDTRAIFDTNEEEAAIAAA